MNNSKFKIQNSKFPFFLLLFFLITACAKPPIPVSPTPTAELLLQQLAQQGGAFDSLRGMARVRVASPERSFTANQLLLAQKPDRLRSETLSPFGNPVLTVAADGDRLSVLVPGEGRFLTGAASYRNLQRFTRLPLQLADLVQMVLYQVPMIPWQESRVDAGADGNWRLTLAAAQGEVRQELTFDRRLRLTGADYLQADALVLRLGYGPFDRQSGFPQAMSIETPAQQSEATLTFSEIELNASIPEERFRLSPPAGYTIEELP
ncbi:MAG: DUF4292 domain-containing protein [Desulfuromonadales bacterium]|nr:DUF4292 domain-containing protein [Desulfuromonadales bacterium]